MSVKSVKRDADKIQTRVSSLNLNLCKENCCVPEIKESRSGEDLTNPFMTIEGYKAT